ncbi:MAG: MMPL family transporter [Gammaproteobacteria bacterium]|nr:MMPL family transporter [Gammaproteobacteria bacterium]
MLDSYTHWVIRWRYLVILIVLALIAWAGSGVRFLQFKSDYRMFFSQDNPQLVAFEKLQNTYTKNDNILFVIAPKDGRVFTAEVLAAVEKLSNAVWQIPYSLRVDSMTNFQHSQAVGDDDLIVGDLVRNAANFTPEDIQRIRHIALNDPLLVNRLISPKAHATGINVIIQLPGKNPNAEVPEVADFARKLANEARMENPNLDIYITGNIIMDNAFGESSEQDMKTLIPLMFTLLIVVLGLLLRTVSGMLITVLVISLSIIPALGLAGWLGIDLSPTAVVAPNIILTLAVADCVHIMTNFFYGLRKGINKRAAIVESFRINFQPVFLTSLTTAIGFLTMNFSDSPPFRDLGNISAMGVVAAFILTMTLLPALMVILPAKVRTVHTWQERSMTYFTEFVIRRRGILLWGAMAFIIGLVAFIPHNELNDEYVKYFDKTIEFRQATDFAADNLTGIYYIDYSVLSGESGGVNNPAFLNRLEAFANWFRQQPEVLHVFSITDILKRLSKNMHGDAPAWYRLPDTHNLSAQYLLLYEMSLSYGLDLNDRFNLDKSATRMTIILKSISSNEVLALERKAQAWLKDNAPTAMQKTMGTGTTIMFAHIGQRNIRSMLVGTTTALILISLLLVFAMRSLKIGLVSLLPNIVPAAMAFGLWGLLAGQVGLALSVVTAMTLGIVVDDTIHFLSKYLRARRESALNATEAVRYAFSTVGTAIWVNSVVLIAGFLVLAFSHFHINSGLGILTAIVIAFALLTDFLFLPPLLMKIEEKNQ